MKGRLALLFLASACGGPAERPPGLPRPPDGANVVTLEWTHRSFEVDVDLTVSTATTAESCSTSAILSINKVTSFRDDYLLENEDCSTLRCTAEGDIVVMELPTEHDWRTESLTVNKDEETITLGPATVGGARFAFVLSAPDCEDDPDCDCGRLTRVEDDQETKLFLGRICD